MSKLQSKDIEWKLGTSFAVVDAVTHKVVFWSDTEPKSAIHSHSGVRGYKLGTTFWIEVYHYVVARYPDVPEYTQDMYDKGVEPSWGMIFSLEGEVVTWRGKTSRGFPVVENYCGNISVITGTWGILPITVTTPEEQQMNDVAELLSVSCKGFIGSAYYLDAAKKLQDAGLLAEIK